MVETFLNFIKNNKILTSNHKVILAISSGIDSMVMLDLFQKSKFSFAIAHCNFQLRGSESDEDERFVKEYASRFNIDFFTQKFNVSELTNKKGISVQMAARELRYNWFNDLLKEKQYDYLATAHHKNDSIETVLYNLVKGTGIAGLHGIIAKTETIIRPMLFASKSEIVEYANKENLKWREDASNISSKYHRNLIRNEVIPLLKQINPKLEDTFSSTMDRISSVEDMFIHQVDELKRKGIKEKEGDYWLDLNSISNVAGKKAVLFELIRDFGFNYPQTLGILEAINHQSGKVFYSQDYLLNVDRNFMIISPINQIEKIHEADSFEAVINMPDYELNFELIDRNKIVIDPSPDLAFIDADKVDLPFVLRPWKHGDRFIPLGMKHQKKLSDFMIDEKIPVILKTRIYVLTSNESIFWVVGHRIDDRVKITDKTTTVLKITKTATNDQPL